LRALSKFWTAGVATCLATLFLAALLLPNSFHLTALSDVIQSVLLFSGAMSLIPHVVRSRGRLRLFWTLITTGITFWFTYQLYWTYYEVWLRTEVPDLCAADMILFLHIVPLMAALALRPHAPQDEYAARLRRLDFALMMTWWAYLYVLIVIPWQYVVIDIKAYNNNLNSLYLIEKLAFLGTLFMAWRGSRGGWKTFYANLFGASLTYATSSYLANWALNRHSYYSGSFYDIPLAISMAWISVIGLWTGEREPQAGVRTTSTAHGVWLARLGMIAAFSLPLFAAWALLGSAIPPRIRSFRLVLTLASALLMGVMVFVRQRLLDAELLRLLTHSRESFANLKHLQAQITEAEKLASIGHLVGGAAHELNNPITAMLGYSDLLLTTTLTPEQRELAARIGQHARRTRSLVASLLSFAKQGPAAMVSVDLSALLRTAVKLSEPQWQGLNIEVRTELPQELLLVRGDSNQLLQVCLHIINNAVNAIAGKGGTLTVSTRSERNVVVVEFSDTGPGMLEPDRVFDPFYTTRPVGQGTGLGLSACYGIIEEHAGKITCHNKDGGGAVFSIELPAQGQMKSPEHAHAHTAK